MSTYDGNSLSTMSKYVDTNNLACSRKKAFLTIWNIGILLTKPSLRSQRSIYLCKNHNPSPRQYFFLLSAICQNLLFMHPFWVFWPFCIILPFKLLIPFVFCLLPFHVSFTFPLFPLLPFFPQMTSADISLPGGGGGIFQYILIYTPGINYSFLCAMGYTLRQIYCI